MYFNIKNYLKNNRNYVDKQPNYYKKIIQLKTLNF